MKSPFDLIFHELLHGIIFIPFGFWYYYVTKNFRLVFLAFLITYLLDSDHLVDYFLYWGPKIDFSEVVKMSFFIKSGQVFVPFHAWEWLIFLSIGVYLKSWKSIFGILIIGMIPHLLLDAVHVKSFIFYSIIFRFQHGFLISDMNFLLLD